MVYILQTEKNIEVCCLLILNLISHMESGKLLSLVNNICKNQYSSNDLVEFIDISHKIAISYLKYQELMGKNIRPKDSEGLKDLEDVALDCIAGLFMRNENGEFVQLKRYFGNTLTSPAEIDNKFLLMLLRRLIIKKTKQELSRVFRERDPEGAKIIRNIRVAIRNSDQFCAFKEMGRDCVYLNNIRGGDHNLRHELSEIPGKILYHQFLEQYDPGDSVSAMMKKMLTILYQHVEYKNYLPIDVMASFIRDVTFQQFKEQISNEIDNSSPFHDLQIKEVDAVNKCIIQYIHNKIENQYLKKNKINRQTADIYIKAIQDFVHDLTQSKACESNFRYLKRYIPNLTQKTYREQERSIFEYLVKITKKSLRKKLKELL